MKHFDRGSEWRRWELHLHTPETQKNDNFSGKNTEEKWEQFYQTISEYIGDGKDPLRNIAVLGITDYLSIDNYLKVVNDKKLPSSIQLVLPNVEMRIVPLAKSSPVNLHCIFNPDLAQELETRFLASWSLIITDRIMVLHIPNYVD